jgi:hypothetical protein
MSAALVVLHHLGGLSLAAGCGLVASHCRTGFAAFWSWWDPPARRPPGTHARLLGSAFTPFEAFPSLAAVSHHYDRCLRGVRRDTARFVDLAANTRLQHPDLDCAARVRADTFQTTASPSEERDPTWTADRLAPKTEVPDASSTASRTDLPRPIAALAAMARRRTLESCRQA